MNEIEKKIMKSLGPEYDHSAKPHVYFFDYAYKVSDGKFKNAVYISKRSTTALDTQDFRRKANDEDKAEFPREWEHYLKVKEVLKIPKVELLPGIDQATLMEMKAVGIYNFDQLMAQDDFEQWQAMARRILNAISKDGSEGRDRVPCDEARPVGVLETAGAGKVGTSIGGTLGSTGITPGYYFAPKNGQEKGYSQTGEVTFSFEVIQ